MLHYRLSHRLTLMTSNSSHLRYITKAASQRQATVKFHGVFASHWKSLVFAPGWCVRETLGRDSGDLVIPFMQADIQSARYYAHFVTHPFSRMGPDISAARKSQINFFCTENSFEFSCDLTTSLLCSDCILIFFYKDFWHSVSEDFSRWEIFPADCLSFFNF